jgi:pimeloyl-ACP methyl ester carboxylesterase
MRVIISDRKGILILLFAFILFSCQSYDKFYFVENRGAIMPVKVCGNSNSQKYIVLLPGGPSGEGLIYSKVFRVFKEQIEANFKMVYYDQRGAGNCQGVYETSSLNLKQLTRDLEMLIETIKIRDPQAKIYLLGYSYGGTLGLSYLKEGRNQYNVEGFISISGAFDRRMQRENQQRLIEYLLKKWVEEGAIEDYEAMKEGFNCNDSGDIIKCRRDSVETVRKVEGKLSELEKYNQFKLTLGSLKRLLAYSFFSQSNVIQSGIAESQNGKYYQAEFDNQMLTEKVGEIRLPVLLINGRYDTNVPFFETEKVYQNIGTALDKKSIVILEESGHIPMITEPERLGEIITDFIESN